MTITIVIETLFYKLNNSVLLGEIENAKMYLAMLREEYENDNKTFDVLKQDYRWDRLTQLGYVVDNNLVVKNFEYVDDANDFDDNNRNVDERFKEEKLLVKTVCENASLLKEILNASDNFYLVSTEFPTRYGNVDIVAQDNDTIYVIELKKGDARYAIISQIDKYMLHFNLLLINKMWRKVVGVAIANSYIGRVLKELVKLNVISIKYTYKNNILRLRKLHAKKAENNNTINT